MWLLLDPFSCNGKRIYIYVLDKHLKNISVRNRIVGLRGVLRKGISYFTVAGKRSNHQVCLLFTHDTKNFTKYKNSCTEKHNSSNKRDHLYQYIHHYLKTKYTIETVVF